MPQQRPREVGKRHDPELAARLERAARQRGSRAEATREREKIITAAVREFITAWHAIAGLEARRDSAVADHQRRIGEIRDHAATEITAHRHQQAALATRIREQGLGDEETAELLEITPRRLRDLIRHARTPAAPDDRATHTDIDGGHRR